MPQENICRVLIVDNELDFAAQTAAKLAEIRPSLLNHNTLEIELTNNAHFAAEALRTCAAGEPPWDVIISDVYMPLPSLLGSRYSVDCSARRTDYVHEGTSWACWLFEYPAGHPEERIEWGGFRIAETMKARLDAGEALSDLKIILMSNCLSGDERKRLLAYQAINLSWLKYYDKADWRRDNLTAWPTDQPEPDEFRWSLYQAIGERHDKDWGSSNFEGVPDVEAVIGNTVTAELEEVMRICWRIGRETAIETVLITGEVGSGREVFAQVIHKQRTQRLRVKEPFVGIDCSAVSNEGFEQELIDCVQEAAGGTLFIDEVDKLPPPLQGRIYHLLKDKKIRSADRLQTIEFAARLTICTARERKLEELYRANMFHDDLYFLLKDEQLPITPLRERAADAISIAEVLAQQTGGVTLADDARSWIATYQWPGNNKELRSVITTAAHRALGSVLTAEDLRRLLWFKRRSQALNENGRNDRSDDRPPQPKDEDDRLATPENDEYIFRLVGDYWRIVYDGKEILLKDSKGLRYLVQLLSNPGKEFSPFELEAYRRPVVNEEAAASVAGAEYEIRADVGFSSEKIDERARREYKEALRDLEDQLEIATQTGNTSKKAQLEEDILAIRREIVSSIGWKGAHRTFADEFTRARKSVGASHNRALKAICKHHQTLGVHLKNALDTGNQYMYHPAEPPPWKF